MCAYSEGREAFFRGDDISLNPYDGYDAQWDEQEDGYCTADIDYSSESGFK